MTRNGITIRDAVETDLQRISEYRRQLYLHDLDAVSDERDWETLRKVITHPTSGWIGMIEVDSVAAGYAITTFCYSIEFGGRFALVDELFVDEAFRGKGVGSAVLESLEEVARKQGIRALRLEVERTNLGAERLYRRQGFEPHDRHLMTKWLDRT